MLDKITRFFYTIQQTPIELYSEFGLQHEFAIFLRSNFPDLIIRLEYPTQRIFNPVPDLIKKEIDIYITTQEGQRYVIELKMPLKICKLAIFEIQSVEVMLLALSHVNSPP